MRIIYWVLFLAMAAIFTVKFVRNLRRLRQQDISTQRLLLTTAGDVAVLVLWIFIFIMKK